MGILFSIFRTSEKPVPAEEANNAKTENVKAVVEATGISSKACFGAGCYWGTEKYFNIEFQKKFPDTVFNGAVGFMGPADSKANPSYQEVCSGTSGHVEVYHMEFKGVEETYERLVRYFFQFHDPSKMNMQGNDKGTQYASVIFCYDDVQERIARKVKEELQVLLTQSYLKCYFSKEVKTDIRKVSDCSPFFMAHQEHQNYLQNNPSGYCNHRMRFKEWPVLEESKE